MLKFVTLYILLISALSLFSAPRVVADDFPSPPKYNRAIVFLGGGFQTGVFLGMLAAADAYGIPPDVIVASCGGAVAAAIAKIFPTNEERLRFLKSREYYDLLRSVRIKSEFATPLGLAGLFFTIQNAVKGSAIPDVYNNYLLEIPVLPQLAENPQSTIKTIIIGSKILFRKEEVGSYRGGRRLFEEVFFTDAQSASLLQYFHSPVAAMPGNRVTEETESLTGVPVFTAARASVADPFEMSPVQIGAADYLTGAVDLYPIEVASAVARETIMSYPFAFDTLVSEPVIEGAYGFKNNRRLHRVVLQFAKYWIDHSDFEKVFEHDSLFPTFHWGVAKSGIPDNYEEYVRRIDRQWQVGFSRAREAILSPGENDQTHIRKRLKSLPVETYKLD